MSGKITLLAVVTFILVGITSPIELIGVPISAALALVFGIIAGAWATGAEGAGAGRRASRTVGVAALLGTLVVLAVLAVVVASLPGVAEFVQASEPHPEARIPTDMIAPLAGAAGMLTGLVVGIVNMIVAWIGGYVATMVRANGSKVAA